MNSAAVWRPDESCSWILAMQTIKRRKTHTAKQKMIWILLLNDIKFQSFFSYSVFCQTLFFETQQRSTGFQISPFRIKLPQHIKRWFSYQCLDLVCSHQSDLLVGGSQLASSQTGSAVKCSPTLSGACQWTTVALRSQTIVSAYSIQLGLA